MLRLLAAMAVAAALSACATPITKAEITPVYAGQAPETINISVVDHRSFILSGNKEEWFEGIVRGGFGIPMSLKRPGPKPEQPFAIYLSSMLSDAMTAAGSKVTVVPIAKGTGLDAAIEQASSGQKTPSILLLMNKSRYDIMFTAEYNFEFDVYLLNNSGEIIANKKFSRFDVGIAPSDKYTVFDMYSEIYKKTLDEILSDPEVSSALAKIANPQGVTG